MPSKSLDSPAMLAGKYKESSADDLLGDVIDAEDVEGAESSVERLNSRIKVDVLQHDIDTVLFTLPARERNVSPTSTLQLPLQEYLVALSHLSFLVLRCPEQQFLHLSSPSSVL